MKTFKHFDLPTRHLEHGEHYIPPKARDEQEIERRRQLATGVLVAEMQQKGIAMAKSILGFIERQEDTEFATKTLAASSINTAWYNHAQGARDVMRRRLILPDYYSDVDQQLTKPDLIVQAVDGMDDAGQYAKAMTEFGEVFGRLPFKYRKLVGATLGNTALVLASTPYVDYINSTDRPEWRQYVARQSALDSLEESRTMYTQVGSNPTLAQLSDPDSPLSVYWRINSPNSTYDALEFAVSNQDEMTAQ